MYTVDSKEQLISKLYKTHSLSPRLSNCYLKIHHRSSHRNIQQHCWMAAAVTVISLPHLWARADRVPLHVPHISVQPYKHNPQHTQPKYWHWILSINHGSVNCVWTNIMSEGDFTSLSCFTSVDPSPQGTEGRSQLWLFCLPLLTYDLTWDYPGRSLYRGSETTWWCSLSTKLKNENKNPQNKVKIVVSVYSVVIKIQLSLKHTRVHQVWTVIVSQKLCDSITVCYMCY